MNKIILRRQRITEPDTLGTLEEKMKKHITNHCTGFYTAALRKNQ